MLSEVKLCLNWEKSCFAAALRRLSFAPGCHVSHHGRQFVGAIAERREREVVVDGFDLPEAAD